MKYAKHCYVVISDPLEPGALATGFRLNDETVRQMLEEGTFTPGTVLCSGTRHVVVSGDAGTRQRLHDGECVMRSPGGRKPEDSKTKE